MTPVTRMFRDVAAYLVQSCFNRSTQLLRGPAKRFRQPVTLVDQPFVQVLEHVTMLVFQQLGLLPEQLTYHRGKDAQPDHEKSHGDQHHGSGGGNQQDFGHSA
jgi:hypothetical protein